MKKSILAGTIILSASGIIVKILGFIYRIYLSNTMGAEGMGLYQLVLPLYLLTGTIAASGISLAVSKLVAEAKAKGNHEKIKSILKVSIFLTAFTGTLLTVLLLIFSSGIATVIFKEARADLSIRYMAPCIPFMSVCAALHGYFYALSDNTKPAVAQILEQLCRMGVVYICMGFLVKKGIAFAAAGAYIGVTIGEVISALYMYFQYKISIVKIKQRGKVGIIRVFFEVQKISLPITASRSFGSVLHMVENTLIPIKLAIFGLKGSLASFGALKGMAFPLIFFPTAFLSSLATTLLPSISEDSALGNTAVLQAKAKKAIQYTLITGVFMTMIFLVFPKELAMAIYKEETVGEMLFLLSFFCPFVYIEMIVVGILAGLGRQKDIFKSTIIESMISILFVLFLVERFGIIAYIAGSALGIIVVSVINTIKLLKITCLHIDMKNWFIKPFISALISGGVSLILYKFIFSKTAVFAIGVFLGIAFAAIIYISLLIAMKCIGINRIKKIRAR